MLRSISVLPVIGTLFRFDYSSWDKGDMFASDEQLETATKIQNLLFPNLQNDSKHTPNKICDVDHLVGHLLSKRDYFVTDDGRILQKGPALEKEFGIRVKRPNDCLTLFYEST